jgi:hypothetical protein
MLHSDHESPCRAHTSAEWTPEGLHKPIGLLREHANPVATWDRFWVLEKPESAVVQWLVLQPVARKTWAQFSAAEMIVGMQGGGQRSCAAYDAFQRQQRRVCITWCRLLPWALPARVRIFGVLSGSSPAVFSSVHNDEQH